MPNSTCVCEDLSLSENFERVNFWLIVVAMPTIAVTGVITNVINVITFSRIWRQNSTFVYLCVLACSDLVIDLTAAGLVMDSLKSYVPLFFDRPFTVMIVFMVPMGYIAQTCSIYFTLTAVIDCYVKTLGSRRYTCQPRIVAACILMFAIVYNVVRFWELRIHECYAQPLRRMINEVCPTAVFTRNAVIYHAFMYTIFMNLLPYCLVAVFTILIVKGFYSEESKRLFLTSVNGQTAVACPNSTSALLTPTRNQEKPIVLIFVALVFITCNILPVFSTVMITVYSQNPPINGTVPIMINPFTIHILADVGNILVVINATANCFIYLVANKTFRKEVRVMFHCFFRAISDGDNPEYGMVTLYQNPHFDPRRSVAPEAQSETLTISNVSSVIREIGNDCQNRTTKIITSEIQKFGRECRNPKTTVEDSGTIGHNSDVFGLVIENIHFVDAADQADDSIRSEHDEFDR